MQRVIYTNSRGESIILGNFRPFLLASIEGTGAVDTDVQMQKAPGQDGSTPIDTLLEPRVLPIEVSILANDKEEVYQYRQQLSRVFNPKLNGRLRYEYKGGVKEVECLIDQAPVYPTGRENRGNRFQRVLLTLICPNPFWLDEVINEEPMEAFIGLFEFPLEFPTEMGAQGDKRILTNIGDVETPVKITFNGPAVNPVVRNNTTGQFIKVNRTLGVGDTLVIDTTFGNKRVEINGQNVFNWIDLDSEFWSLQVGDNEIEYTADSGRDEATLMLEWRNRYVGI